MRRVRCVCVCVCVCERERERESETNALYYFVGRVRENDPLEQARRELKGMQIALDIALKEKREMEQTGKKSEKRHCC